MSEMEAVFGRFFRENLWGAASVSGPGSTAWPTAIIREAVPALLRELAVETLLDAPCGDFNWLSTCALPARYIGCDVVGELVDELRRRHGGPGRRFERLDLTRDPLPAADLVLCRDCLGHLPFADARAAIANFRASGARYLLATTFPHWSHNRDIAARGDWRPLNLEHAPFALGPPLRLVAEVNVEDPRFADKSLGLWELNPPAAAATTTAPADSVPAVAPIAAVPAPTAAGTRARRSIWVAGFPSEYGGADTELDHQIALWRRHDVDVHLVPMFGADPAVAARQRARGCHVHDYRPDVFRGQTVVSYCNGSFLAELPRIMAAGRPARVVWFNCMTWLFDGEREAHRQGWIDVFGFVSAYQRRQLEPQLAAVRRSVATFDYRPYFDVDTVAWRYRPWDGSYRLGRISRDDAGKFAADTWRIFDRVLVPRALAKKVYILGHGPNAAAKIGAPPPGLDWQTWSPGAIPATTFYRTIDTLVHKTGGSRESYCRVVVEAYAHGVVPIVEDDYAFAELVDHERTGVRTSDSDEMSWWASVLARDPARHRAMAERGRSFLAGELADEARCWAGWRALLDG
jgi:glycosyltransferase involved in cell wall biosynthesis